MIDLARVHLRSACPDADAQRDPRQTPGDLTAAARGRDRVTSQDHGNPAPAALAFGHEPGAVQLKAPDTDAR